VIRIEIGRQHYLLYLLLSHPRKMALLSPESRAQLDEINRRFNEAIYSGPSAAGYDAIHGYGEEEQHDYPARALIEEVWAGGGYGCALELGAGSGYFTALIARNAERVIAVEPVADLGRVLRERCHAQGLDNVEVVPATAQGLGGRVPDGSVDTAFVIQSLHHFHRRPEVFSVLTRLVRPGGRLLLLEPHHNLLRAARLFRKYCSTYRAREFWTDERNWATHDFVTRAELVSLSRAAGFERLRITGYWIPLSRRFVGAAAQRFRLESRLGRLPGIRHVARVLALEAWRAAG
jgi:ubiquinone/menaquinone biosynthesis C-methylase UbiE